MRDGLWRVRAADGIEILAALPPDYGALLALWDAGVLVHPDLDGGPGGGVPVPAGVVQPARAAA